MEKNKKPFYKKWWFWVIVVILFFIGLGSHQQDNSAEKSNNSSSSVKAVKSVSTSSKAAVSKSSSSKTEWTEDDYNALATGDIANYGQGGTSYNVVVDKFGKPSSTSESTISGAKDVVCDWTNVKGGLGSNIALTFTSKDGTDANLLLISKSKAN